MKKTLIMVIGLLLLNTALHAQEAYMEVIRSTIKAEKVAAITEEMAFSDAEAAVFWPIYREYEVKLAKINDERLALIRDYALNYEILTEDLAKEMVKSSFSLEEQRLKLRKEYYAKFEKALSPIRAAKFNQLERRINLMIDLQIAAALPILK